MKIIDNVATYKVAFLDTDYDTLERINKDYGYCEFNTSFHLDKETYHFNREMIRLGNDTYLDLDNLFNNFPEKLKLLLTDKIDFIIIEV